MSHILVVEDDERLRHLIQQHILRHRSHWTVSLAGSVKEARLAVAHIRFDALVVDVMMPKEPGTDLLRDKNMPPILLLTAMGDPQHRVDGLTWGAKDYLVKPFEPQELVLRLTNMIKNQSSSRTLRFGSLCYCVETGILKDQKGLIFLSTTEKAVLGYLCDHPHQLVTREELWQHACPEIKTSRTIDVVISRLRKKIEPSSNQPQHLVSCRGQGYILHPDS